MLTLLASYLSYTLRKTYQKSKEKKWLRKATNRQFGPANVEAQTSRVVFNNQPFNPEVCTSKSFLIVSALFCCVCVMGVIIGLYVETVFPIFIFFARFFLSVVGPSIIYANNTALRVFVKDMLC